MRKIGILSTLSFLALAACQSGGGPSGLPAPVSSTDKAPVTCERTCNSGYDSCMDRFPGVGGGSSLTQRSTDPTSNLGPNDVCPDQLKSCLRRCGG